MTQSPVLETLTGVRVPRRVFGGALILAVEDEDMTAFFATGSRVHIFTRKNHLVEMCISAFSACINSR